MKKLTLLLGFLVGITNAFAQSKAIMEFHERFKDNGKYLAVKIDGGILKFLSKLETDDDESKEVIKTLSKLEAINIHAIDRKAKEYDERFIREFVILSFSGAIDLAALAKLSNELDIKGGEHLRKMKE